MAWDVFIPEAYSLFIWSSNLTGCPVVFICFTKTGNSSNEKNERGLSNGV